MSTTNFIRKTSLSGNIADFEWQIEAIDSGDVWSQCFSFMKSDWWLCMKIEKIGNKNPVSFLLRRHDIWRPIPTFYRLGIRRADNVEEEISSGREYFGEDVKCFWLQLPQFKRQKNILASSGILTILLRLRTGPEKAYLVKQIKTPEIKRNQILYPVNKEEKCTQTNLEESSTKGDRISSVGKDTHVEISQPPKISFVTASEKNQNLYKQNLDLIEKKWEIQKNLISNEEEFDVGPSLEFEFGKSIEKRKLKLLPLIENTLLAPGNSSQDNHSLLVKDINSSKSMSDKNKEVSVVNSSASLNSSEMNVKVSYLVKDTVLNNSENFNLNEDKNVKSTESHISFNKNGTEELSIDVISQKPVVAANFVNKTLGKEANFKDYVDSNISPTSQSLSNSLQDNHSLLVKDINSSKSISDKNKEMSVVNSSASLNSSEMNVKVSYLVKNTVLNNSENFNLNEDKNVKSTESHISCKKNDIIKTIVSNDIEDNVCLTEITNKLFQQEGPNSCKSDSDLSSAKKTLVVHNCDLDVNAKNISVKIPTQNLCNDKKTVTDENVPMIISSAEKKIEVDDEKLIEMEIASNKSIESLNMAKEECTSKTNLTANELEKTSCNSHLREFRSFQYTVHQEVNDNKSAFASKLSSKRKLEAKNRSSKRHRSNSYQESNFVQGILKNADQICFSVESVKTMLNIMKAFVDI